MNNFEDVESNAVEGESLGAGAQGASAACGEEDDECREGVGGEYEKDGVEESEEMECGSEGEPDPDFMKTLTDPGKPTQAEIDRHNVNHLPFRSWCPQCVAGRARDRPHKHDSHEDRQISAAYWNCLGCGKY